jgi:hypothetical protein
VNEGGRKIGKDEEGEELGTHHDIALPAGEEPREGGDQGMP